MIDVFRHLNNVIVWKSSSNQEGKGEDERLGLLAKRSERESVCVREKGMEREGGGGQRDR